MTKDPLYRINTIDPLSFARSSALAVMIFSAIVITSFIIAFTLFFGFTYGADDLEEFFNFFIKMETLFWLLLCVVAPAIVFFVVNYCIAHIYNYFSGRTGHITIRLSK